MDGNYLSASSSTPGRTRAEATAPLIRLGRSELQGGGMKGAGRREVGGGGRGGSQLSCTGRWEEGEKIMIFYESHLCNLSVVNPARGLDQRLGHSAGSPRFYESLLASLSISSLLIPKEGTYINIGIKRFIQFHPGGGGGGGSNHLNINAADFHPNLT